jgi:hypothetical protein
MNIFDKMTWIAVYTPFGQAGKQAEILLGTNFGGISIHSIRTG